MKKYLPNFFTLLNLTIGSIGLIRALKGNLTDAALCIWIGAFFDFLDGWVARMLKTYSPLGQQLDSLADLITFGCLPASIMYELINKQTSSAYVPYVALLLISCSALRLARFNTAAKQQHVFIGLPVPANAILISTLPWIINGQHVWLGYALTEPYTLVSLTMLASYLLITEAKLMAFKFTNYAWHPNRFEYIFLLIATKLDR